MIHAVHNEDPRRGRGGARWKVVSSQGQRAKI